MTPANAVVASGSYASGGSAIAFNGAQVTVTGTPAAGDTFTDRAGRRSESMFETLDDLVAALDDRDLTIRPVAR